MLKFLDASSFIPMTRSGPSLSQSHDVKSLGCRFRPRFTERLGGCALCLYIGMTHASAASCITGGERVALAEAQRAATLKSAKLFDTSLRYSDICHPKSVLAAAKRHPHDTVRHACRQRGLRIVGVNDGARIG